MSREGSEYPGRIALRAIDAVLAQQPHKDDPCLSKATQCLCAFRDHVIEGQRADRASEVQREQLARLNSILSVVLGCHFPLDTIPWHELEGARRWLADLVAEMEPRADAGAGI